MNVKFNFLFPVSTRSSSFSVSADISSATKGYAKAAADAATIINAALATDTASGAIASFPDGAEGLELKSLILDIKPYQAGSGDPSPQNVRPISGHTGADVTAAGKNLGVLNADTKATSGNQNATDSYSDGGSIITATGKYGRIAYDIPVKKGLTYTVSFKGKSTGGYDKVYVTNEAAWTSRYTLFTLTASESTYSFSFEATTDHFRIGCYVTSENNSGVMTIKDFQLELGSATSYEPYTGRAIPITWQDSAGTVYGGTLDVVSGVLTKTHAYIDLGDLTWTAISANNNFSNAVVPGIYNRVRDTENDAIMSAYAAQNTWLALNLSDCHFMIRGDISSVYIRNDSWAGYTAEQVKAALTGVTFVYRLATPIEYTLTPEQVVTLLGQNNIWADTGDVEVEYYADTKLYINKIVAALA